tara:strand:- start:705 stop:980 length:276 start_codon:yes stop_codon:yes gene_type:complete
VNFSFWVLRETLPHYKLSIQIRNTSLPRFEESFARVAFFVHEDLVIGKKALFGPQPDEVVKQKSGELEAVRLVLRPRVVKEQGTWKFSACL